jgi:hypothetical protein
MNTGHRVAGLVVGNGHRSSVSPTSSPILYGDILYVLRDLRILLSYTYEIVFA